MAMPEIYAVFDPDVGGLKVNPARLVVEMTAGEDIPAKHVVSIGPDDGKAYTYHETDNPFTVGVALGDAAAGGVVKVCVYGVCTVIANVAISRGDKLVPVSGGYVEGYTGHTHDRSVTKASTVADISAPTDSASIAIGVSETADPIDTISKTVDTFVKSIPSKTGDAHGRYTKDGSGYLHHDHAIGSPTTGQAVKDFSVTRVTVVKSLNMLDATWVRSVSPVKEDRLTDVYVSYPRAREVLGFALTPAAGANEELDAFICMSLL